MHKKSLIRRRLYSYCRRRHAAKNGVGASVSYRKAIQARAE